jgi:hypothetical protein
MNETATRARGKFFQQIKTEFKNNQKKEGERARYIKATETSQYMQISTKHELNVAEKKRLLFIFIVPVFNHE